MQIHISRDGQQFGPYSLRQVREYLTTGNLVITDLAWYQGAPEWMPLGSVPGVQDSSSQSSPAAPPVAAYATGPATAGVVQYHHVSRFKFILLSLVSFGIYEIYWFYKNWSYVRKRDGSGIRPFWRAFFSLVWCQPLIKDLNASAGPSHPALLPWLSLAYLLVTVCWRLPDPYWLVSVFSFVPLIPLVRRIDQLNRERGVVAPYHSRFGPGAIVLGLLGAVLLVFSLMGTFHLIPSTKVVAGAELPGKDHAYLRSASILGDGETLLFFYTPDILSIKSAGNILTDQRVLTYEKDETTGKIEVTQARFPEIKDVKPRYGTSSIDATVVSISKGDGDDDQFEVTLSTESGGDRQFVERLLSLWNVARQAKPPAAATPVKSVPAQPAPTRTAPPKMAPTKPVKATPPAPQP